MRLLLWIAYFPWKKYLWFFFEAQEGNTLLQEDIPLVFFPQIPQTTAIWWLNLSFEVLNHPNGVTLDGKYVCGPACLYNLLGILVLFCIRETNFLVLWWWRGGPGLLFLFTLPECETFGWGWVPALWRKGLLLDFPFGVGLSLWFLFSPKRLSKLKLNLVS